MHTRLSLIGAAVLLAASSAFAQGTTTAPATPAATPMTGNSTMGQPGASGRMSSGVKSTKRPTVHHRKVAHHRVKHEVLHPVSCSGIGKTCPPGRPPGG